MQEFTKLFVQRNVDASEAEFVAQRLRKKRKKTKIVKKDRENVMLEMNLLQI